MMSWFYACATKTLADLDCLVHNVILADNVDVKAYDSFSAAAEAKHLDKDDSSNPLVTMAGWTSLSVSFHLPCAGFKWKSVEDSPLYTVSGVLHQDLVDIMRSAFQDNLFFDYHLSGYKEMWKPLDLEEAQRVYGETYTSETFL